MHSPRPVSAESTLRGRTARALYHIPAGMCQKTPIRTDREGERTRIRTGGTINTSMPQHRNAKPAPSPAEQVRLPLQWCVYFRALRAYFDNRPNPDSEYWQDQPSQKERCQQLSKTTVCPSCIKIVNSQHTEEDTENHINHPAFLLSSLRLLQFCVSLPCRLRRRTDCRFLNHSYRRSAARTARDTVWNFVVAVFTFHLLHLQVTFARSIFTSGKSDLLCSST